MYDGNNNFESERVRHNKLKRDVRKRHINEAADEMGNQIGFKCDICDRLCLTRAGLKSHQTVHQSHQQIDYNLSDVTTCHECGKVCKSAAVLKRRVKIHGKSVAEPLARAVHVCRTCARECKSLSGIESPTRAIYGKSSDKPPGGYLFFGVFNGAYLRGDLKNFLCR